MKISKAPFGQFEGAAVDLFTLENDNGVVVKITNYGGIVTSIVVSRTSVAIPSSTVYRKV